MDEVLQIPAIVAEKAREVKGVPIAWNVETEETVIVFEDGRKIRFQTPVTKSAEEADSKKGSPHKQTPVTKTAEGK